MKKISSYLEIIRYPLFAIPIVATLPGALIASEGELTWRVFAALIIAQIGYFAGMMKNDYFHRDQDAIVNRHRPIPSGRLSERQILATASTMYLICVFVGFALNFWAGLIVIGLVMISHTYNAILKQRGIFGSIILPIGIGSLSIFGSVVVSGEISNLVWYVFGAIALYDFGTHIISTFKDIERDRRVGILTTPIQIGILPSLAISGLATIGSFLIAFLPRWTENVSWSYAAWIVIAFFATMIARIPLYLDPSEKNGYLALKGSMIGAITFFPCLIGTIVGFWSSAIVILPLLFLTLTLLQISQKEV